MIPGLERTADVLDNGGMVILDQKNLKRMEIVFHSLYVLGVF